jgi:sigma-B regulation protein RsbU (phosphoserine phosphatase)
MPEPPGAKKEQREESLASALVHSLVAGRGMNEFLHRFLQEIGIRLGITRLALYDYDELADTFELLYFCGYPGHSRSTLQRRIARMDIRRALKQNEPYRADTSGTRLLVPLYFQTVLEAVLMLEADDLAGKRRPEWDAMFLQVSRFLGLFMSSSRLPVNEKLRRADISELERAREVQMRYLPSDHPVTDGYEIFGFNQSASLVGGDYFDYFRHRAGSVQCVVADACGHGMAAALIMSAFRGFLLSELRHDGNVATLFRRINDHLFAEGDLIQYLTGVFVDYQEASRRLTYINAGHFDPVVIHPDGTATSLPGGGPPLGMFQDSPYAPETIEVRRGDLLVLFTDGLVELRDAGDNFLGVQGILTSATPRRGLPLRELAQSLLADAARFSHEPQPDDDLTLFLMRFR